MRVALRDVIACITICIQYSQKYWRSLNLAVWTPNDIIHTIQDLNLAVWYGIAIRTCMRKKIWRMFIWRFKGIAPNFPAIQYVRDMRLTRTRSTAQFTFSTFQKLCRHHDAHIHMEVTCSSSLPLPSRLHVHHYALLLHSSKFLFDSFIYLSH